MKKQYQQGLTLFFSLIILFMMTAIGTALAINSTASLRMAGSGAEKVQAVAAAHGALEKILNSERGSGFANLGAPVTNNDKQFNVNNTITPMGGDVSCQRSMLASATNLIQCRRFEIESEAEYGRDNMGRLVIVTGVEQMVLTGS